MATYNGNNSANSYTGTSAGDSISGNGGNDTLYGGAGIDTIYGGSGNDSIYGGDDNDVIDGGTSADSLSGGNGDDSFALTGTYGNDTIAGGANTSIGDTIDASGLTVGVTATFSGTDVGTISDGTSTASFSGIENFTLTGLADTVNASAATSAVNVSAGLGADTLTGGSGADTLAGGGGNDQISGGSGNDSLDGGLGADSLSGGSGDDAIYGGSGSPIGTTYITNGSFSSGATGWSGTDLEASNTENAYMGNGSSNNVVEMDGGSGATTVMQQSFTVDGTQSAQLTFRSVVRNSGGTVGTDGFRVDVLDSSGTVIGTMTVLPTSNTTWANYSLDFTFPAAGTYTLRFTELGNNDSLGAILDDVQITATSVATDAGNDTLDGGDGNDTLYALGGNDIVSGVAGNDVLYGGDGNDSLDGGADKDTLYGDAGNDSLLGGTGNDLLYGGDGNDTLDGGADNDTLYGDAGSDSLLGAAGNDSLYGGDGNDTLDGGADNDTLYGDAGNDSLLGAAGNDSLFGGAGNDTLSGGDGNDSLDGGTEADSLYGDAGNDTLNGAAGADGLYGGAGIDYADYSGSGAAVNVDLAAGTGVGGDAQGDVLSGIDGIFGSGFDDTLLGYDGESTVPGDLWTNVLYGAAGNDSIDGRGGSDSLYGGTGNDTVIGGTDNDLLDGGEGNDSLTGDAGNDSLFGGMGDDRVYGGADSDLLDGGDGNDLLFGGLGNDVIYGGAGDDTLQGDAGADTLSGGTGNELFVVEGSSDAFGDVVDGGENSGDDDVLDLTNWGWARTNILYDPMNPENGTVEFLDAAGHVIGTLNFSNIEKVIPCFTPGVMITTDHGAVAVEDLRVGDLLLTRDHGLQPIRWIGTRKLGLGALIANPRLQPVKIGQGALGDGLPLREMLVSPQHRMLIEGALPEMLFGEAEVLVAASHLTAWPGIVQILPAGITYIHLLLDHHEIICANGAWTESFQPAERMLEAMEDGPRAEIAELFPELSVDRADYPAARLSLKAHEAKVLLSA